MGCGILIWIRKSGWVCENSIDGMTKLLKQIIHNTENINRLRKTKDESVFDNRNVKERVKMILE